MIFSSLDFYIFFTVYAALHFLLPRRAQFPLLVAGSLFFYGYWDVALVAVPLLLVALAYGGGLLISRVTDSAREKTYLALTILFLLLPLLYFKYTNFILAQVVQPLFGVEFEPLNIPLPIGISFITFTIIAYVVDVYRKVAPVERNGLTLTGYIMFFPQLIAGPIMRPNELIPQLGIRHVLNRNNVRLGIAYFTIGLVKKLLFADQLAPVADAVFAMPPGLLGWDYLLGVLAFSVQIYCDFSGYTDMAIGAAIFLGITLPENFERPYLARSVAEFWRRWHITLSLWIRDYLYIPLGGNRCGVARQFFNVMIAMSLCGLWHGANWNFVVWGAVHGLAIIYSHVARNQSLIPADVVPRFLRVAATFVFVVLAWVLFRSQGMDHALAMYGHLVTGSYAGFADWARGSLYPLGLLGVFFALHPFDGRELVRRAVLAVNPFFLGGVVGTLWLLVALFGAGSSNSFIYFDF